jgi:hypothetical protein
VCACVRVCVCVCLRERCGCIVMRHPGPLLEQGL